MKRWELTTLLGLLGLFFVGLAQASDPASAPPEITSTAPTTAQVGQLYTYQVDAVDPEAGPLSYELYVLPTGMTISSTGLVSWTPTVVSAGEQTFKVTVRDQAGLEASQYVDLLVEDPTNNAPVINQEPSTSFNIGDTYTYDLQASDADGDTLTYSVWSWPAVTGLTISTQGVLTWSPSHRDEAGEYWVSVEVDDGRLGTAKREFELSAIDATNQAPVIGATPATQANIDTLYTYDLQATDADGDTLTYELSTWPTDLGIVLSGSGVITWTPTRENVGENWVSIKVHDGHLGQAEIGYELNVIDPNNHNPVFTSTPLTQATQGTEYEYAVTVSDADSDAVTLTLFEAPAGMVLDTSTNTISWTPTQASTEGVGIKIDARDNFGGFARQEYTLIVNEGGNTNNAPIANDQSVTSTEDVALPITLLASDPEGQALSYSILSQPLYGSLSGTGAELTYTPQANFFGADSFTFVASDGALSSNLATVSITVTPANDAPLADNITTQTNEDTALDVTLTGSDIDGDSLIYTVAVEPTNGSLSGVAPSLTYTPAAHFSGTDVFTYSVNDGSVSSGFATVSITVTAENDVPLAQDISSQTTEDTAVSLTLVGNDNDGDALTYVIDTQPLQGVLSGTVSNLLYTPNANVSGTDTFTYHVNDGQVNSTIATVTMTITSVNDSPVAAPLSLQLFEDTASVITLQGSDLDGDSLTYVLVSQPQNGVLSGTGSNVTYIPNANYNGSDSFSYRVNDGTTNSNTAIVSLTVNPVNDVPVATAASANTEANQPVNISLSATDIDGDVLAYSIVSQPQNGTVTLVDNVATYTPAANFSGADSFTFVANDGVVDSNTAAVSVTVTPPVSNNPPEITSTPVLVGSEGASYSYQAVATDPDNDALTYALSDGPIDMVVNSATGLIEWATPVVGEHTVVVTVTDIFGASAQQTYSLFVTPPLPPVTSQGTDFWFMFNQNYEGPFARPTDYLVYVVSENTTEVTVDIPSRSFQSTYPIQSGEVITIDLTEEVSPRIRQDAIHLTSELPVVVYLINKQQFSTDAAMVYPTNALGMDYSIATFANSTNSEGSMFGIVATEDNTLVRITPTLGFNYAGGTVLPGIPYEITLNRGEAHQASGRRAVLQDRYDVADLSGTTITADRPIAVFGSNVCTSIQTSSACDHLIEQMIPIDSLGANYLTLPLATRLNGDTIRVYAVEDDTLVRINGEVVDRLQANEYYTTLLGVPGWITANRPIQVMQFSNSSSFDGIETDPFMVTVPPEEQFLSAYTVTTPADGYTSNFLNVIIHSRSQSSVRIDGNPIDSALWQPIANSGFVGAQVSVAVGTHTAYAAEPFGLYSYGFDNFDSYGYNGGMAFSGREVVAQLTLSSTESTLEAGTQSCLSAQLSDAQGNPVPQAQVKFSAANTNPAVATELFVDLTDLQGQAEFCYTRPFAVADTITATSQTQSDTLILNWQNYSGSVNQPPFITSQPIVMAALNQPYQYQVTAYDLNGDSLTYALTGAPAGMTIDSNSGLIQWPITTTIGSEDVVSLTVTVTDSQGATTIQTYQLSIEVAPNIEQDPLALTGNRGGFSQRFYATDQNANELFTWQLVEGPDGSTVRSDTGNFDWTLSTTTYPGVYSGKDNFCRAPGTVLDNLEVSTRWQNVNLTGQVQIGPLYDSNQDGVLNASDRKAVVGVNHVGYIIAAEAATGKELWRRTDLTPHRRNIGALIDLDNDQSAEFLFIQDSTNLLVALNSDGSTRWISTQPAAAGTTLFNAVYPTDLNNDGAYEILFGPTVFDANGQVLWQFPISNADFPQSAYGMSLAADLDLDGFKEVIFYDQVRDWQGNLLWSLPGTETGRTIRHSYFAAGNFDSDPELELAVNEYSRLGNSHLYQLRLVDNTGSLLWERNVQRVGYLAVADFTNDGDLDIYQAADQALYSSTGSEIWNRNSTIDFSTATVADVDADGILDILQLSPSTLSNTSAGLFVYDGATGQVSQQYSMGLLQNQPQLAPVFMDMDNDGQGEILATGSRGTFVFEGRNNNWTSAMPVYAYHQQSIGAVNDNLRFNPASNFPYFAQTSGRGILSGVPANRLTDLVVRSIRANPIPTGWQIETVVANRGFVTSTPTLVELFHDDPTVAANKIGEFTLAALPVDINGSAHLVDISDPADLGGEIFAVIQTPTPALECTLDNNIGSARTIGLSVTDLRGLSDTEYWSIGVTDVTQPPRFLSTPPNTVTVGQLYEYQIVAEDTNRSDILRYFLESAPHGASIDSVTGLVRWIPTRDQIGSQSLRFRAVDQFGLETSQGVAVRVDSDGSANTAPVITSSPVTITYVNANYRYQVSANDADGDDLSFALTSSPAGMTINGLSGRIDWQPMDTDIGSVSVTVSVTDSEGVSVDQAYLLVVNTSITNTAPTITSSPTTTARTGQQYSYQITAVDAENDPLTYTLEQSPAGMSLSATGLVTWTPDTNQTADVTVRVSDGATFAEQNWSITSSDAVLAGAIQVTPTAVDEGETVTVQVTPQNAVAPVSVTATVDGTPITLDASYQAQITATGIGPHTVEATITDQFDTVVVTDTFTVRDPADTTPPVVSLSQPLDNSLVTAPTDIVGSVNDTNLASWRVLYAKQNAVTFVTLAEGTTNLTEQTLATFDPTLLDNGQYVIVLEASDINAQTTQAAAYVTVEGDLKVGNFSFTVEDINVPLAGLPIRVTRTYDSRRKAEELDFGYSWSVGYQDASVEESRDPGLGWQLNTYPSGPFGVIPNYCVEPQGAPVVSVKLPTGEVERFETAASPQCNTATPILDVQLTFNPIGDNQSTLQAINNSVGRLVNGNLADVSDLTPLNPSRYQLTTRSGYIYTLNEAFGIETVVDPNGHTLTYSDTGIVHSSGKSVSFVRDVQNRITQVIDPTGNAINYAYDTNGDLLTVTERDGAVTTHSYHGSNCATASATADCHLLDDMLDPLGRRLVRNIYDTAGRLIAQEDQNGNRTEFNHDIAGRQSIVTDRNGNTTVLFYDERGNVTNQVDALGNTKTFTFDANDNQLTQTNELGNVTTATYSATNDQLTQEDALGNVLSYAYNTRGQETQITDARGNVFNNAYDTVGNLLSVTDPDGNIAGNNINAQGLVSSTVDAEGNTTTFTYDSEGNKLTETDPLGTVTTFTYDNNNNVLTETRTRSVNGSLVNETTSYVYDNRNRVTQVTDALGNITQTEYDLAGQEIASIDALGRRTEMDYDVYGNLLEMRYPDGSTETHTYDAENNKLTSTDRLGRTTQYVYDALNRQTSVIYPDGTSTQTEYDAAGRVTAEVDERGNRTTFEYDVANRRTATVDALGNRHEFNYDADGNLIDETDANSNTTAYTYNSLDQRTQTTFADNSVQSEVFDALSRRTQMTDQAGISTSYAYDALGRLLSVTDTLGQVTTYTYDEQGNKLTQTDAAGRTTSWTYDALGRVLTRTLPLGQVESFVYDPNGNMTSRTDFNGHTHSYTYDINDRLTQTDYADGSQETFSYDAVGNRTGATITDGAGTRTWAYSYDSRNRLTQEVKPNGDTLDYTYDAAGNKATLTTTQGTQTATESYVYDALNRLSQVTDRNSQITTYSYDAVGNRAAISYANGNITQYSYDNLNRLTSLTTDDGLGGVLQSFSYTLNATGRRTQITENNGRVTDYVYDDLYRLTSEAITDAVNGNYSAQYTYDSVGNRTQSIIDGVTTAYSYDDNDRITQYGGTTYTYDANGNTLTETLDGVTKTYTYNSQNEMVSVEESGNTTTYEYNAEGIRNAKTEAGIATRYLVDHNRDYAQVLVESDNGTEVVSYTYGDDLLSQQRGASTSFYHYDGLGSTRGLSDNTGSLTDTYAYEAFGEVLNQTGTTQNNYLFTGEQFDSSLNQYYLRARYYNQGNGRFTQMDTWMGRNQDPITLHKYLYANADPANMVDPTGNFSIGSVMTAVNIMARLATTASTAYDLFSLATGDQEVTAQDVGIAIILSRLPTKFASRFISKACKRNSFIAETLVATEFGLTPIAEIKIGDRVWAYNEQIGKTSLEEVVHLITGEGYKELVDIELSSGEVITATSGHPFYLPATQKWIDASDLTATYTLLDLLNNPLSIISVVNYTKQTKVYNLTVANDHTYYVGQSGALVHNANDCKFPPLPNKLKNKFKRITNQIAAGGNRGVSGAVTSDEIILLGMRFVGKDFTVGTGRKGVKVLWSKDRTKQFTYPTAKKGVNPMTGQPWSSTGRQSNFESRPPGSKKWTSNVHVDVK